ncbi:MAG: hypothetical protein F6K52_04735 [Moorea sp. SIO3H5]|nr:hypothetical protein [Moorena sp. SIO3H5]
MASSPGGNNRSAGGFPGYTELHSKRVDWLDKEMGKWGDGEIGGRGSYTFDPNLISV